MRSKLLLSLILGLRTASGASAETPGIFIPTGDMTTGRSFHTATLLRDGRVLIVGGAGASAEIYNPATGTFSKTGDMTTARGKVTATLLDDGRVLITGGIFTGTAELFDPSTGTFTPTGDLVDAQIDETATLLKNGKVLIAGGVTSLCCRSPN